ncbi:MAG: PepSY domain-containing protein [Rhizobiales bacterium]|nr:PepSY domain-containing protein [Hyphomicrobiales bacterium]
MPVPRSLLAALLLGLLAVPAFAADAAPRACLSKAEQRAAVADHKAISLAQAVKSLREHGRRAELVRARLCHRDNRLVYVLTLLARSGKVTSATVDAASGDIINGR